MLTLLALSAALTLQDPPAPPPGPPPPEMHMMMIGGPDGPGHLDRDGDGQISRDEFSAPLNDAFSRMDKDGDGRLSHEEMAAAHGSMGEDGHDMMLMRHPGGPGEDGVRRFEFRRGDPEAGPGERRDERVMVFTGAPDGAGEHRIEIRDADGHGDPVIVDGAEGNSVRVEIRRMGGAGGHDEMDRNHDGKISEDEFLTPMREAFGQMDADHSGFIEEGEHGADGPVRVVTRRVERQDGDHH